MSEKSTLRALLGAGIASAMVAASAAGAFAATEGTPAPEESSPISVESPSPETTDQASPTPTEGASESPSEEPSTEPSENPTDEPTDDPSDSPTDEPTGDPTEDPSDEPTENPSEEPTEDPSDDPTEEPGDDDDETVEEIIKAPAVEADAKGEMDVKADWTVTKKVVKDTKKVTGKPGGKAKVPYRVEASATGVLSNIKITGDMNIKNADERDLLYTLEAALYKGIDPEDKDDLKLLLGSSCAFNGVDADPDKPGFQVWITSGESLDVTYACTAPDETVSGADLATAPFSFWSYVKAITAMGFDKEAWADSYFMVDTSDVDVKNQLVNLYDVNSEDIGGEEVLLGTVDATKGKHVYEYDMNVSIPNQGCYDFDNVALAVNEDDDVLAEDSATIKGCAETPEAAEKTETEVKPAGTVVAGTGTGTGGTHGGGLAATGAESTMLGGVGAALVGIGALAFGLTRRARKA